MEFVVVRGDVSLTCTKYGQGRPAAVLLHGLAGYAGEWQPTVSWLATSHSLLALDQRGHGASTRYPGDMSRAAYVADAIAVIEGLDTGPVVLIGQSLGAHTAMLIAAQRPDLVAALVVAEASPECDPDGPSRVGRWLSAWPVPFATLAAAFDYFQGMNYFHSATAARVWADGLEERSNGWWPRFDVDVMVESLREVATNDYWDQWEAIRCPTLVVRGEHGALTREGADDMLARLAKARLAEIGGAGHDVHLDQAGQWRQTITNFLFGSRR